MNTKVCYKWDCKRHQCRKARLNSEVTRIELGIQQMQERGDKVWFLTVTTLDEAELTYDLDAMKDFAVRVSKLLERLREWASRVNHPLLRVRVFGFKGINAVTPYQLHAHVICSWIPDPKAVQEAIYVSPKLNEYAEQLNLKIHLEITKDPIAIARYSAKNVQELEGIELPSFFQRISYSRNWRPLDYQRRRKLQEQEKRSVCLTDSLNHMEQTLPCMVQFYILSLVLQPLLPYIKLRHYSHTIYSQLFATISLSLRSQFLWMILMNYPFPDT